MKMTIKEIASLAGVSITTVSQILNNKGSRFSSETRQKVLDVVEKYHYKPDFFAKNMIIRHTKTIGMIVPDVTDFFFSKVIEGVETYLNPLGYMILLCNSKLIKEKELLYIDELLQRSVDGIILATPFVHSYEELKENSVKKRTPFIFIDRGLNEREEGRFIVKEYEGAYQAIQYLIENGHKKIGMLKEMEGYYQLAERLDAYKDCLLANHLEFDESFVKNGQLTMSGGYQAAEELLIEHPEVTAVFCGNDEMAVGAYQAITRLGKKIPEDISVVGFDNLEIAQYIVPSLTTIAQPTFDIGFYAAKFMVDAIDNPERRIPSKIFETEFLIRNSTKSLTAE